MKQLFTLIFTAAFLLVTAPATGDLVIREEPLTWEKVATLEGHEMYGNLCAACHGVAGRGNGPAATLLYQPVPDLTTLALQNDGVFSRKKVERVIYGKDRTGIHDTIDMPAWGQQFYYLRTGWNPILREAYTRNRINALTAYVESLQVE